MSQAINQHWADGLEGEKVISKSEFKETRKEEKADMSEKVTHVDDVDSEEEGGREGRREGGRKGGRNDYELKHLSLNQDMDSHK